MKRRLRILALKSVLVITLALGVTLGILSLPRKVEGVYSAGALIQCACDGSDYLRFHKGLVIHYSTNHEPAELFGRYEVRPDGSVAIYMFRFREDDPEELVFTLGRPRVGFAIASSSEDARWYLLLRLPAHGKIADLIAHQEVRRATISDETILTTTFYDSSLAVIRKETKPIKKPRAEQADIEQPATRPKADSEGGGKPQLNRRGAPGSLGPRC
jgi:hypothetical protein